MDPWALLASSVVYLGGIQVRERVCLQVYWLVMVAREGTIFFSGVTTNKLLRDQ